MSNNNHIDLLNDPFARLLALDAAPDDSRSIVEGAIDSVIASAATKAASA